ncbi:colicin I receptor precursor [mine drainage metagenome]|uniref:Colicin I receptor n=1 Tax=mine drainage metagenome TaxID=410659 RepID=A0A1J5TML1_9ZZZZ
MKTIATHRPYWFFFSLFACAPSTANATDFSDFTLEDLLEVSITGASKYEQKQGKVAAAVSVISRNEIKAFGWRTLSEALNSLPGMYSTYDRQYSYIGTRGLGVPGDYNSRVLLTINGNRVNDTVYDQALIGREFQIDLDLVECIEFIPGPGSAVYGQNALFGVINIVTRSGASVDGAELAAAYQSPQAAKEGRATWGKKLDNGLDILLSASGYKSKGDNLFFDYGKSGISGIANDMDGERDKEYFAQLARGPWSFDFSYGNRRKDDPTADFLNDPLVPGQYQQDKSMLTQLQYQDKFSDDTLQLSGRLFSGRERYTGEGHSSGEHFKYTGSSDWWGSELRLLSTALRHHKLMLGLEYQDNGRRDQTLTDFNHLTDPLKNANITGSGWRQGLYGQDEWALSEHLSLTVGLRIDRNSFTKQTLSPRLGVIWQPTSETTIKTMYGRAYRAPNAYERDYADQYQTANPNLINETIDTLELVVDKRVSPSLRLHGSIYQWNMQRPIVQTTDSVSGLLQFKNDNDVNAHGIEVGIDKTWSGGGRLRGSLNYQTAQYSGGVTLHNSPHLMGKLNFSSPLPVTGLSLGYELQSYSKRETIINGTYSGGYVLSNLNLTANKWIKGTELSLGIYNLFDKQYSQPTSDSNWQNTIRQDGRQIRLKAIYRF